jgi:hypothetical protein
LQQAAWISGGDHVGIERRNELGLAVAQFVRRVWLHEIVDTGGAAADG